MTDLKEIGWQFDNSYARRPKIFFSKINPTPVKLPKLIILNDSLALSLGLSIQGLQSKEGIEVFSGNHIPEGAYPIAQAYAGHQFGYFTMLGDGRVVLLGEQITPKGERFDIQLKGSGRTPYSRGGDGMATLGPMLREYIMSEAMHALGISTTRSLAVVSTGETVIRETELPGAILTRVSTSHLRVGTFQYIAKWGTFEELQNLAEYTITRHFSEIGEDENRYLALLREVMKRQAALIAKWQLVGFIHGVMNTDNMAISGETIDYGPCAFMDTYDPSTVFSSIDTQGRYSYGNQPILAEWNLARFAETLLGLINENQEKAVELAENVLSDFRKTYQSNWIDGMRAKLGLFNQEPEDATLIEELLTIMKQYGADYTNTFRKLTLEKTENSVLYGTKEFDQWYEIWQERLSRQKEEKTEVFKLMKNNNPSVIPRNYLVEEALDAAVQREDFSVMQQLLRVITKPYEYNENQELYSKLPEKSKVPYRTFCGT